MDALGVREAIGVKGVELDELGVEGRLLDLTIGVIVTNDDDGEGSGAGGTTEVSFFEGVLSITPKFEPKRLRIEDAAGLGTADTVDANSAACMT